VAAIEPSRRYRRGSVGGACAYTVELLLRVGVIVSSVPAMPWLGRHVALGRALPITSWRKVAIGTWRSAGDPSVYVMLELNAEPALAYLEQLRTRTETRLTLSPFVGKVVAETLRRHPEINCVLRFGRLYPRQSVDLFFQVATDPLGKDLSGTTIRQAETK